MIYLKNIFNGKTSPAFMALSLMLLMVVLQVEASKIAYKKPIHSKPNSIKDKHNIKTTKSTTKPQTPAKTTTAAATTIHDELEVAETTHAIKSAVSTEDEHQQHGTDSAVVTAKNSMEFREVALPLENWVESEERTVVEEPLKLEEVSTVSAAAANSLETPTTAIVLTTAAVESSTTTTTAISSPTTTKTSTVATTPSNRHVPCTCGIFMTSQIKRTGNPYELPIGGPVIMNELDRTYPCNAVGQKQCQTKCLEMIVQHLPNSANILCASLDHDIRKERAYLFIKNCRNQWFNTNLAAGREYCCKNGQPYQCPMV